MTTRPDFLVICNHGGPGAAARVALLPWFPNRPGWWPAEDTDPATARVYPMEGTERGWDPKWLRPEWTDPDEPDARRWTVELSCPDPDCTTWSYRTEDDRLQVLLSTLADRSDETLTAAIESAGDTLVVVRLQMLHRAREYAKRTLGLRV